MVKSHTCSACGKITVLPTAATSFFSLLPFCFALHILRSVGSNSWTDYNCGENWCTALEAKVLRQTQTFLLHLWFPVWQPQRKYFTIRIKWVEHKMSLRGDSFHGELLSITVRGTIVSDDRNSHCFSNTSNNNDLKATVQLLRFYSLVASWQSPVAMRRLRCCNSCRTKIASFLWTKCKYYYLHKYTPIKQKRW